jgi:hypothetical protein
LRWKDGIKGDKKSAEVTEAQQNTICGGLTVPVIESIHQKVYEAANQPEALNMSDWHTCDTTHCRAGWVTFLGGPEAKALEQRTSTLFAAMQIYHKSCPEVPVSPTRFFESNAFALEDMRQCAEKEKALQK